MPLDRGALDAQLRAIGETELWWNRQEFRELTHVLHPGEAILGLVSGTLLGVPRPRLLPRAPWLVVATDQRLVLLRGERDARRQIDIVPAEIVRVHQRSRLRSFLVAIETPLRRHRIRIAKEDAYRFVTALARLVPQLADGTVAVAQVPALAGGIGAAANRAGPEAGDELAAVVGRLRDEVERLERRLAQLEERLAAEADRTAAAGYGDTASGKSG
jgi:hypothetical protein